MQTFWQKVWMWTKVSSTAVVMLYVVLFVYNNSGKPVTFWWWFGHSPETSVFILSLCAFLIGVVCMILARALWKTVRQFRQMNSRSKADRIEREVADMKAKAAMLQTRPDVDPANSKIIR
jgi:lysylphosphatidylglycerol synthetase-like protein (DUF2156 family)